MEYQSIKSNPLVSICMPLYNGEKYLAEALTSILNQTFDDFEVLITDDSSSDTPSQIVADFKRRDARIKYWRNESKLGLFANYNRSFSLASGHYIKPMAQDDVLMPEMLARCLEQFEKHPTVSLVSCDRHAIDSESRILEIFRRETPVSLFGDRQIYTRKEVTEASLMPIRNIIGEPCTVMFRAADRSSGFSEKLKHTGDLAFWIKLLKNGDLCFIAEKLACFRQHQTSASMHNVIELHSVVDVIFMADLCREELDEYGISERAFILRNLSDLSITIVDQFSKGSFSDQSLMGETPITAEEIHAFKKALLHSFLLMNEGTRMRLEEREEEWAVKNAERRLKILMRSSAWRATAFLRQGRKLLNLLKVDKRKSETPEKTYEVKFESSEAYLKYLREEQRKILKSKTWKLGRSIQSRLNIRC